MSQTLELLNNYFKEYKLFLETDDITINSILDSMLDIDSLDDLLITSHHASVLERWEFYEFIYNHQVFSEILKQCWEDPTINALIYKIIFVEIYKISMLNSIPQNPFVIGTKQQNKNMILRALEKSQKDHELYPRILELLEDNKQFL
jgi:hypothetical protein